MDGLPESVAHLVKALRPAGLWYGALTTVVIVSVWCLQDQAWEKWPTPIRCATWWWLVASVAAVPYTHVVGAFAARAEREAIRNLPVAGPPVETATARPVQEREPGPS
jgi:hypothetical protein